MVDILPDGHGHLFPNHPGVHAKRRRGEKREEKKKRERETKYARLPLLSLTAPTVSDTPSLLSVRRAVVNVRSCHYINISGCF
mmetsp:Transcript_61570/g.115911  ORF Transcript_61570/g.115911 Transcript_61570/m.115911 type:complete len:83 (-) Transcript_61570:463-711(-)